LIIMGPPGSGKGTQTEKVGDKLGIPKISTGDILREAAARKTELGMMAASYMDEGNLVPDEVMLSLVEERLGERDCSDGFILDGFPRTLAQGRGLERILEKRGEAVDAVILLDVDDETVFERLTRRRVCPSCSALYNLGSDPPGQEGFCDRCGVQLVLRADDEEATVRIRLGVYRADTLPLVEYYESKGNLKKVDGSKSIDQVFAAIMRHVDEGGRIKRGRVHED
jgi:adenylate kinase